MSSSVHDMSEAVAEPQDGAAASDVYAGTSSAYVPSRWLRGLTLDPRDRHEVAEETSGDAHGNKMRTLRSAITEAGKNQK
jgi:hypothetical protein